jgi:protein SCO1
MGMVMKSRLRLLITILAGIFLALVLGIVGLMVIGQAEKSRSSLPVLGQLPDFEFIKQDSTSFGLSDMKGKINVVDFIFTRCQSVCPLMTPNMAELYKKFAGFNEVQFVSITVDPEYDTLNVLREYANSFGVDDSRWVFLRNPIDDVIKLSEKGFMLPANDLPMGHSSKFILVDQQGMIRAYYDGTDRASVKKLIIDIRALANKT